MTFLKVLLNTGVFESIIAANKLPQPQSALSQLIYPA